MKVSNITRIFSFFIIIFILASVLFSISALGNEYRINDMEMNIMLPDNMLAITRNSSPTDLYFETYHEPYEKPSQAFEKSMTMFKQKNIYLFGRSDDNQLKVTVTMISDESSLDIFNYNFLNKKSIDELKDRFLATGKYTQCQREAHGDFLFLDLSMDSEETDAFIAQSNTIINGMNINFIFESTEPINSEHLRIIKEILQNIKFDQILPKPKGDNTGPDGLWILVIGLMSAIGISCVVVYRSIQKTKRTRRSYLLDFNREARRGKDVSDLNQPKTSRGTQSTVKGIKSSSDYFDRFFEHGNNADVLSKDRGSARQSSSSERRPRRRTASTHNSTTQRRSYVNEYDNFSTMDEGFSSYEKTLSSKYHSRTGRQTSRGNSNKRKLK